MKVWSELTGLFHRLRRTRARDTSRPPLREFVYLDEVSVYSLLASRKGGIPAEFTESHTASLDRSVGGTLGIGLAGTKTSVEATRRSGHIQASQVLRKAIIQTSFKELYELERASLAMTLLEPDTVPEVGAMSDLEERIDTLASDGWIADPNAMRRGELLEVEVELEADLIFRMASVITTVQELMEDNEVLFGHEITAQLPQMRSMAQMLERLLFGLVPIRARLADYRSASIGGREVLVHLSILEQLPPEQKPQTRPTFVVSVAQHDLFWKDIRQLLFSRARHTTFCRLATSGMADTWNPIKVADVLSGIVPRFDEMMRDFNEQVGVAMNQVQHASPLVARPAHPATSVMRTYVEMLFQHHGRTLALDVLDELTSIVPPFDDWLSSVDSRRPVFDELTQRVDETLGRETSREVVYDLRLAAMPEAGSSGMPPAQVYGENQSEPTLGHDRDERFLDAEIISIYW